MEFSENGRSCCEVEPPDKSAQSMEELRKRLQIDKEAALKRRSIILAERHEAQKCYRESRRREKMKQVSVTTVSVSATSKKGIAKPVAKIKELAGKK